MWAGWGDVANQPEDRAARGQVIERLETLVGGLQFSQASLGAQWNQTRENLDVLVDGRQRGRRRRSPSSTGRSSGATQAGCPPTTSPTSATSWS